jgi:hypothetical protein
LLSIVHFVSHDRVATSTGGTRNIPTISNQKNQWTWEGVERGRNQIMGGDDRRGTGERLSWENNYKLLVLHQSWSCSAQKAPTFVTSAAVSASWMGVFWCDGVLICIHFTFSSRLCFVLACPCCQNETVSLGLKWALFSRNYQTKMHRYFYLCKTVSHT